MEQFELEYLRKEKYDWEMSTMILGNQIDTLDKFERHGKIAMLDKIISKYEDVVVAP
jgi:hypothetical protein